MTDRKTSAPWIVVAVLLVLIGGYVGTYYATVQPQPRRGLFGPVYYPIHGYADGVQGQRLWVRALHRWRNFFFPIHWLDRRVRPHVWDPTP